MQERDLDAHHSEAGGDEIVDRYLADLEEVRAPATLIPRVQAALAARAQRPWWRRSYRTWNRSQQGGTVLLALACLYGLSLLVGYSQPVVEQTELPALLQPVWAFVGALTILWETIVSLVSPVFRSVPVSLYYALVVSATLTYFLTVGAGAALVQLLRTHRIR